MEWKTKENRSSVVSAVMKAGALGTHRTLIRMEKWEKACWRQSLT